MPKSRGWPRKEKCEICGIFESSSLYGDIICQHNVNRAMSVVGRACELSKRLQWDMYQEYDPEYHGIDDFSPGGHFWHRPKLGKSACEVILVKMTGGVRGKCGRWGPKDRSLINLKDNFMKFGVEVQNRVSRQCQNDFSPGGTLGGDFTTLTDFDQFLTPEKHQSSWGRNFVSLRDN